MQNIRVHFISYFSMKICWHSNRDISWYSICHICWCSIHSNFIIHNFWIISNAFEIFIIFPYVYARILTIIFFAHAMIFTLILTWFVMPFLIWITCCTIRLAFTITWNMFFNCFSFISIWGLGTHTFADKSSTELQLPLHYSWFIKNRS